VQCVVEEQSTDVAGCPRSSKAVPEPRANPEPLIEMVRPGCSRSIRSVELIVGASNVNSLALLASLVPLGVTIVTLVGPVVPAAVVAVTVVGEVTLKLAAASEPTSTFVTARKPVPVIVSDVPPAAGPLFRMRLLMAGASPGAT